MDANTLYTCRFRPGPCQHSACADAATEMFQHGLAAGRSDALTRSFSPPIPAEDGAEYTEGYLTGYHAHIDAIAEELEMSRWLEAN